ncbi:hypothetical protein BS299_09480 [Mycobacterium tuberculosis M13]|nr:hypothetical protein BS299_09480 [Mycobacterium tuberculosis M13]
MPTVRTPAGGGDAHNVRSLSVMWTTRLVRSGLAALCAAVLVSSGCARFNDAQSQPFTTEPERGWFCAMSRAPKIYRPASVRRIRLARRC